MDLDFIMKVAGAEQLCSHYIYM